MEKFELDSFGIFIFDFVKAPYNRVLNELKGHFPILSHLRAKYFLMLMTGHYLISHNLYFTRPKISYYHSQRNPFCQYIQSVLNSLA